MRKKNYKKYIKILNKIEKIRGKNNKNWMDILDDAKAENLRTVDLSNKSSVADSFIIATCRSTRHADATADELSKQLKKLGLKSPTPEGRPKCDWVIVDAGSVIVHLFKKETREIYNLEQLWEINFESEKNKLAN